MDMGKSLTLKFLTPEETESKALNLVSSGNIIYKNNQPNNAVCEAKKIHVSTLLLLTT